MSEGRSIKKLVQLVTIDNNCILPSRLLIQRGISLSFNLGEFTADPFRDIYMTPDGLCQSFTEDDRKQGVKSVQKVKFFFIDNTNDERLYNFRDCAFPRRSYEIFTDLKDKQCLKELMTHKELDGGYDFCVFPNELEMQSLITRYEKSARKEITDYSIAHKIKTCEEANNISSEMKNEINEIVKNIIREINIDFIWEKQQQMKDFIERHQFGNLPEDKILWLNEQLENVSEVLMNNDSYLWEKIRQGTVTDTTGWDIRTAGEKDMRNALLVPAYRIYGHYALCCLEIFIDIQNEFPYFICGRCKKLVYAGKNSKKRFCSKDDNKECFMEQQNARKRKSYKKKKKLKEEKII